MNGLQIKQAMKRNTEARTVFKGLHPSEQIPDGGAEGMNGLQIGWAMKRNAEARAIFKGVHPSNQIPNFSKKPFAVIYNTEGAGRPGAHWVSFYVTRGNVVEFFDTYGRSPLNLMFPVDFKNYIKDRVCRYNTKIVEGFFDNTCGEFCIYMLCLRTKGMTFYDIVNFLSYDTAVNHSTVLNFIKNEP